MIQGFYSAVTGASQQMKQMDVHGNNIANVNTYGFKAEKPSFQALMYNMVDGVDGELLPKGSGTLMASTATDFSSVGLTQTGRNLDYAIEGEGFFALYDPDTEEISYTRDGSFTLASFDGDDGDGWYLSDGQGRLVLDADEEPIKVTDPKKLQPVGVFNIQYQDGLQHVDSSRFVASKKNGDIEAEDITVLQGYLESSNTDLAAELGKVIEAQRAYTYALRMVTTADEVETTINNLTT